MKYIKVSVRKKYLIVCTSKEEFDADMCYTFDLIRGHAEVLDCTVTDVEIGAMYIDGKPGRLYRLISWIIKHIDGTTSNVTIGE